MSVGGSGDGAGGSYRPGAPMYVGGVRPGTPIAANMGGLYGSPNGGLARYDDLSFSGPNGRFGSRVTGYGVTNTGSTGGGGAFGSTGSRYSPTGPDYTSTFTGNPNDPNYFENRYQAKSLVTAPEVAGQTDSLLNFTRGQNANAGRTFQQILADATAAQGVSRDQLAGDLAKWDTSGSEANIRDMTGQYQANTRDAAGNLISRYNTELGDYGTNLNRLVSDQIGRENGLLPEYDKSLNDIADAQTRAAIQNLSRYKLRSGTPTSMGGDEFKILGDSIAAGRLPLERERIGRRFDLAASQGGLQRGAASDIASRRLAGISGFEAPLRTQTNDSVYNSGMGAEKSIQALRQATAGLGFREAQSYMASMGVPQELAQQVIRNNISNLSALAGLDKASHERTIWDREGAQLSQPQSYLGGYPNPGGGGNRYPVRTPQSRFAPLGARRGFSGDSGGDGYPGSRFSSSPQDMQWTNGMNDEDGNPDIFRQPGRITGRRGDYQWQADDTYSSRYNMAPLYPGGSRPRATNWNGGGPSFVGDGQGSGTFLGNDAGYWNDDANFDY